MSYMLPSSHALQINLQDFIGATQDLLYRMVWKTEIMRLIGKKEIKLTRFDHDLMV
jgi:hypothetical protein